MPFQLKAFNIVICLIFTYVFTHSYYNFWFSLIFAIMTCAYFYIYILDFLFFNYIFCDVSYCINKNN